MSPCQEKHDKRRKKRNETKAFTGDDDNDAKMRRTLVDVHDSFSHKNKTLLHLWSFVSDKSIFLVTQVQHNEVNN
jgi:hypothetical protein